MGNCVGTQARTTPECPRHKPTVRASTATVSTNHNSHSKMLPSDLLSEIAAVLSDLLPMWKEPKARDLDVSIISGGISNALYRVSLRRAVASPFDAASFTYEASTGLPADEIFQQTVVLRVYGENTEKFVDRAKEVETMRMLHKHGFGPEVLGVFGNGRVESYLRGKACLAPDDLGKEEMSERIAEVRGRAGEDTRLLAFVSHSRGLVDWSTHSCVSLVRFPTPLDTRTVPFDIVGEALALEAAAAAGGVSSSEAGGVKQGENAVPEDTYVAGDE